MSPDQVERDLYRTAAEHALPEAAAADLPQRGPADRVRRVLRRWHNFNGFYGYGIVDAYAAVKTPLKPNARP